MSRSTLQNWRRAHVMENRQVADGSRWLTLKADDGRPATYEPGHVLSLALEDGDGSVSRHPYTVSGGDATEGRFSHLYRVITDGRMTPRLQRLQTGDEVLFRGPAHNPIREEIDPDAGQIVGVATGTGIGPLYGFAAQTLLEGEFRPVTLFAGVRRRQERALLRELEALDRRYPHFSFAFTLTQPDAGWDGMVGRVQASVPSRLDRLGETHLHLVGRGDMVHLWRRAWMQAGFDADRVSIETYFHHDAEPHPAHVDRLASELRKRR